jgi:glycosyltransferase involved in cell wall biosynthesis
MRILFSGYLPLSYGGYPNQMRQIVAKLRSYDPKIEIGIICWNVILPFQVEPIDYASCIDQNYTEIDEEVYKNVKFYLPGDRNDVWIKLESFCNNFNPDKVIFYQDILNFEYYNIGKLNCKLYLWLPIHNNFKNHKLLTYVEKHKDKTLNFLPLFDKIATFSNFGMEVLKSYNYKPFFINHAIDNNVFYKKYNKQDLRTNFNIDPSTFVCLMIANNSEASHRKAFSYNLSAFKLFSEKNENCLLLLKSKANGASDLNKMISDLGISRKVKFIEPANIPTDSLIKFYCISDVLLSASKSEGFGIPIVEAQFCGLPVITTNCTAMPENTYNGICTEPSEVSLKVNGLNSWSDPSVDNIKSAMEKIYSGEYTPREFDKEKYNITNIFKDWKEFLEI